MNNIGSYIAFIKEVELLKGTLRTAWQSDGRQESTAEHSWRLALFASAMLAEYPGLDSSRVLTMCLIHDLGEVYEGDISAALHPDPDMKLDSEQHAVTKVFSLLPAPVQTKYMEIWQEYEECSSAEARFVKALDKAETIIQHNQGQNPEGFDYEFNLHYGSEYFQNDPILAELRRNIDDDTKTKMENVKQVFIQIIEKPARKVIIKRGIKAADYWEYCHEVGCDVWGILTSIKSLSGEPVCLWLPKSYRLPGTSEYVQGVEVDVTFDGQIPEGFDVIELPAAKYLMFQGQPFAEEDYCEAIGAVQAAMDQYDPAVIGYCWGDEHPRIQLEPVGTRGYIELRAVAAFK